MGAAWYTFPRIDNFGMIDPAGPYWKPDSNIQLPGFYPITALLPGTVTSVQSGVSWGQTIVTIQLDTPLNALATHTFYEHMSSATVSPGQHVNAGDLIGYNNPPGAVPLGFGLYSGDVYGSGSAWSVLQNDLKPGGAGLLNPVSLLDSAKSGIPYQNLSTVNYNVTTPNTPNIGRFGQRVALFIVALVLFGAGAYLLLGNAAKRAYKKSTGGPVPKLAIDKAGV